ncbi:Kinase [Giardia muris]|uniref:Kinase n=1 Tax=Giardia muris TaxID=5742 RepID=A0A4Z1T926_GIAMU|nr:Kinase [Giardia muris]|eukprot:TNJ29011.1 Kinase [Giardia muris]
MPGDRGEDEPHGYIFAALFSPFIPSLKHTTVRDRIWVTRTAQGNICINEWIIQRTIGRGAYANVRLCTNPLTEEKAAMRLVNRVALHRKILSSERADLFLWNCARVMDLLSNRHPAILELLEVMYHPFNHEVTSYSLVNHPFLHPCYAIGRFHISPMSIPPSLEEFFGHSFTDPTICCRVPLRVINQFPHVMEENSSTLGMPSCQRQTGLKSASIKLKQGVVVSGSEASSTPRIAPHTGHNVPSYSENFVYVVEHCDGGSLGETLRSLPFPRLLQLLYQVADALAYMHFTGIVHQDIKLENVLCIRTPNRKTQRLIDLAQRSSHHLSLPLLFWTQGSGSVDHILSHDADERHARLDTTFRALLLDAHLYRPGISGDTQLNAKLADFDTAVILREREKAVVHLSDLLRDYTGWLASIEPKCVRDSSFARSRTASSVTGLAEENYDNMPSGAENLLFRCSSTGGFASPGPDGQDRLSTVHCPLLLELSIPSTADTSERRTPRSFGDLDNDILFLLHTRVEALEMDIAEACLSIQHAARPKRILKWLQDYMGPRRELLLTPALAPETSFICETYGTPNILAPESRHDYNAGFQHSFSAVHADAWQFGVLVYHALTNTVRRSPVPRNSATAFALCHHFGILVADLICGLLDGTPSQRYTMFETYLHPVFNAKNFPYTFPDEHVEPSGISDTCCIMARLQTHIAAYRAANTTLHVDIHRLRQYHLWVTLRRRQTVVRNNRHHLRRNSVDNSYLVTACDAERVGVALWNIAHRVSTHVQGDIRITADPYGGYRGAARRLKVARGGQLPSFRSMGDLTKQNFETDEKKSKTTPLHDGGTDSSDALAREPGRRLIHCQGYTDLGTLEQTETPSSKNSRTTMRKHTSHSLSKRRSTCAQSVPYLYEAPDSSKDLLLRELIAFERFADSIPLPSADPRHLRLGTRLRQTLLLNTIRGSIIYQSCLDCSSDMILAYAKGAFQRIIGEIKSTTGPERQTRRRSQSCSLRAHRLNHPILPPQNPLLDHLDQLLDEYLQALHDVKQHERQRARTAAEQSDGSIACKTSNTHLKNSLLSLLPPPAPRPAITTLQIYEGTIPGALFFMLARLSEDSARTETTFCDPSKDEDVIALLLEFRDVHTRALVDALLIYSAGVSIYDVGVGVWRYAIERGLDFQESYSQLLVGHFQNQERGASSTEGCDDDPTTGMVTPNDWHNSMAPSPLTTSFGESIDQPDLHIRPYQSTQRNWETTPLPSSHTSIHSRDGQSQFEHHHHSILGIPQKGHGHPDNLLDSVSCRLSAVAAQVDLNIQHAKIYGDQLLDFNRVGITKEFARLDEASVSDLDVPSRVEIRAPCTTRSVKGVFATIRTGNTRGTQQFERPRSRVMSHTRLGSMVMTAEDESMHHDSSAAVRRQCSFLLGLHEPVINPIGSLLSTDRQTSAALLWHVSDRLKDHPGLNTYSISWAIQESIDRVRRDIVGSKLGELQASMKDLLRHDELESERTDESDEESQRRVCRAQLPDFQVDGATVTNSISCSEYSTRSDLNLNSELDDSSFNEDIFRHEPSTTPVKPPIIDGVSLSLKLGNQATDTLVIPGLSLETTVPTLQEVFEVQTTRPTTCTVSNCSISIGEYSSKSSYSEDQ